MPAPDIPVPARIAALPFDKLRGFHVPWFVAWVDGKPEFRGADFAKFKLAVKERRCWVCGDKLTRMMTFVAGPMCGLNRTSSEPPCHTECARYSVRVCPFLTRPDMDRRERGMEKYETCISGEMIRRNPGVALLWTTKSYALFRDGKGGVLLRMGPPEALEWWAEGRAATRAEVEESVRTGLPALEAIARLQPGAMEVLAAIVARYPELYPA
jgi:hypothetical protein